MLDRVSKIKWIKTVTRPMFLYGQISQTEGERDFLFRKIGFGFKNKILFPVKGGHTQYFAKEDWSEFVNSIKRKLKENENWPTEYTNESYKLGNKIEKSLHQIFSTSFSFKKNDEILQSYQKFEGYRKKFAYLLYPYLVLEKILEKKLRKELARVLKKTGELKLFDKFFNTITFKTLSNESDKEEEELLRIAKEFIEEGEKWNERLEKKLETHTERYGWLPYYGYGLPLGDKNYFKRRLVQIKNPERVLSEKVGKRREQEKALRNLKRKFLGTTIGKLISIIQVYLHLRVYRTEVLRKSYYYPRNLLKEVGKRIGLSLDDSFFLTPKEIKNFLRKGTKPIDKKIKERKAHYALIMVKGEIKVVSKEADLKALKQVLVKKEEEKILKGNVAFPGMVRGRALIVYGIDELNKVKGGDVLVSPMTTPEMTVALHKVAAIVTDEGGVTCHAAIVARELKIPCIVGTKRATKVLKDGDLVEVNAQKGIVRIIGKYKI